MMDVTCDMDVLMQMLDATCDTNDLMKMVDKNPIKQIVDDSLPDYEIELFISNELMEEFFVKDDSIAKAHSENNNSKCEFKVIEENIYE